MNRIEIVRMRNILDLMDLIGDYYTASSKSKRISFNLISSSDHNPISRVQNIWQLHYYTMLQLLQTFGTTFMQQVNLESGVIVSKRRVNMT